MIPFLLLRSFWYEHEEDNINDAEERSSADWITIEVLFFPRQCLIIASPEIHGFYKVFNIWLEEPEVAGIPKLHRNEVSSICTFLLLLLLPESNFQTSQILQLFVSAHLTVSNFFVRRGVERWTDLIKRCSAQYLYSPLGVSFQFTNTWPFEALFSKHPHICNWNLFHS